MTRARSLQAKRLEHRIPGHLVAAKLGTSRSRLCAIENEYFAATQTELDRIDAAINGIIAERQKISELAEQHGLSLAGAAL